MQKQLKHESIKCLIMYVAGTLKKLRPALGAGIR